jgi:hypothetical protein
MYVRAVIDPDAGIIDHALGGFSGSCLSAGPSVG